MLHPYAAFSDRGCRHLLARVVSRGFVSSASLPLSDPGLLRSAATTLLLRARAGLTDSGPLGEPVGSATLTALDPFPGRQLLHQRPSLFLVSLGCAHSEPCLTPPLPLLRTWHVHDASGTIEIDVQHLAPLPRGWNQSGILAQ
jgi:hypothetical protein